MIETKFFKSRESMNKWIVNNSKKYQIWEVFVNNAYCIEYRKLRKIL